MMTAHDEPLMTQLEGERVAELHADRNKLISTFDEKDTLFLCSFWPLSALSLLYFGFTGYLGLLILQKSLNVLLLYENYFYN